METEIYDDNRKISLILKKLEQKSEIIPFENPPLPDGGMVEAKSIYHYEASQRGLRLRFFSVTYLLNGPLE